MTSSLVGSEMCIRDSPMPASRKRLANAGPLEGVDVVLTCTRVFRLCKACLLYTSDAADDM
eukprot:5492754-Prorocentrum_lima.AAC.1